MKAQISVEIFRHEQSNGRSLLQARLESGGESCK